MRTITMLAAGFAAGYLAVRFGPDPVRGHAARGIRDLELYLSQRAGDAA